VIADCAEVQLQRRRAGNGATVDRLDWHPRASIRLN